VDPEYEKRTLLIEEQHWWYRGRRAIVRQAVAELGLPAGAKILDAGCGSGRNMVELASFGDPHGVDISENSIEHARQRGFENLHVASLTELPFEDDTFDLVTTLDVIEHTDDDVAVLRELLRVAKPAATLVVTVPAYPALWSSHDVQNQHRRRYTRRTMLNALRAAVWQPVRTTHFNALLLGPAAAYRALERVRPAKSDVGGEDGAASTQLDATPPWANAILERVLLGEAAFLRGGRRRIPAGLSLMAVARKPA
jgi:SAM-dependent methyltransferase